jgi:hypothetical protein
MSSGAGIPQIGVKLLAMAQEGGIVFVSALVVAIAHAADIATTVRHRPTGFL